MITTAKIFAQGPGTRKIGKSRAYPAKAKVIALTEGWIPSHMGATAKGGLQDGQLSHAVWGDQHIPLPLIAELIGGTTRYTAPKPIPIGSKGHQGVFLTACWAFEEFIVLQETHAECDEEWNLFRCVSYEDTEGIDAFCRKLDMADPNPEQA